MSPKPAPTTTTPGTKAHQLVRPVRPGDGPREQDAADRHDDRAEPDDAAAHPLGEDGDAEARAHRAHDRERHPDEPGPQHRPAEAGLEVDRLGEEVRRQPGEEEDLDGGAAREAPAAVEVDVDERLAAGPPDARLAAHELEEDARADRHEHESPSWPAELVTERQGEQDGEQPGREDGDGRRVQAGAPLRARLGDPAERRHEGEDADRHVDEEDRPPPRATEVGLGQQRAEDRPDDRRDAGERGERAHRPARSCGA